MKYLKLVILFPPICFHAQFQLPNFWLDHVPFHPLAVPEELLKTRIIFPEASNSARLAA